MRLDKEYFAEARRQLQGSLQREQQKKAILEAQQREVANQITGCERHIAYTAGQLMQLNADEQRAKTPRKKAE